MARVSEEPAGSHINFRITVCVCLFYLFACFLPCIDGGPDYQTGGWPDFNSGWHFGLIILLFGWANIGKNDIVPWSANGILAIGLVQLCRGRVRAAFWFGILASMLGLTTWWVRRYDRLMIGYYVWQSSLFMLAGGAAFILRKLARETTSPPLTEAQKQDLQHRLADHEASRHAGSTGEEVKSRLQER